MVYELVNKKHCYLLKGSDGKIYGDDEGYDGGDCINEMGRKRLKVVEGFAIVKKYGKWYYLDVKDFKLHGEGYDDAWPFSGGVAIVEKNDKDGKRKYRYRINKNFEKFYRWERFSAYKEVIFINKTRLEEADYLKEVEDNVMSIVGIPAIIFSEKFVKKLKGIVFKYYQKEIEEVKSNEVKSDKVEALRSEMEYIKKIIDEKKEQYSEKVADPNYQSLLKQAQSLF